MRPFRRWFSRIYWDEIAVDRPSYVSRVLYIALAVVAIALFVALFYDPAEAHKSHTPLGYAHVSVISLVLLLAISAMPALVPTVRSAGGEPSPLASPILRI